MTQAHWCKEHQQPFFKKGTMRNYAHPIKDSSGKTTIAWCDEPEDEVSPELLKPKSSPAPNQIRGDQMSKEDWTERDRITRKSIERQKALELAVEVAKIKGSDTTEKIISTAKVFEAYLEGINTKEVSPAKKLVDEVRKMG